MDLLADLRTKAARERAWLVGDREWMRRWLFDRARDAEGSGLELKSRFGARCLELAVVHTPGLFRKSLPSPHWEFEPRIPAGNGDESGRWTRLAGDVPGLGHNESLSPVPAIRAGTGHHVVAEGSYKNKGLSDEAIKVFRDAKTGKLLLPKNNYFDEMHRNYNKAVSELLDSFLEKHNIKPETMTGDQARGFVREVLKSTDPKIRNLNLRIFRGEIREILKRRVGGRE